MSPGEEWCQEENQNFDVCNAGDSSEVFLSLAEEALADYQSPRYNRYLKAILALDAIRSDLVLTAGSATLQTTRRYSRPTGCRTMRLGCQASLLAT